MKIKVYTLMAEGGNAYWGFKINTDLKGNVLMLESDVAGSGNSHLDWYPPLAHMYEPSHRESVSGVSRKAEDLIKEIQSNYPQLELNEYESENDYWQTRPLAA